MSKLIVTVGDIETTGLEQEKGHRIIEVCFSVYSFDKATFDRRKVGTLTQRINPMREIDPAAQAVHGISAMDLRGEPVWEDVAPKVERLLEKTDIFVAHNGEHFDAPFIALELIRIGRKVPPFAVFDTMLNGRGCTPFGKVPNLGELCSALGVEYDPELAHSAEYDVNVLADCYWRGIESGLFVNPAEQVTTV